MPEGEATSSAPSNAPDLSSPSNPPDPQNRSPFRPLEAHEILGKLSRASELVERVIARALQEQQLQLATDDDDECVIVNADGSPTESQTLVPLTPTPVDPILDAIEKVISGFKNGESLEPIRDKVRRLITAQESRAELIQSMMVMHDLDRLPKFLAARSRIETFLTECAQRGDLSPAEGMAFLKLIQDEIKDIGANVRSKSTSVRDVEDLVDKADFVAQLSDEQLAKKFEKTSTLGREIIRKVSYRILKAAKNASR